MVTSPTQISNCVVWLDATDTTTLSSLSGGAGNSLINTSLTGDFVGGWGDKSGNSRHFTNIGGSATTRPTWVSSLSTVRFDGSDDFLSSIFSVNFANQSVFLVGSVLTYTGAGRIYAQVNAAGTQDAGANNFVPLVQTTTTNTVGTNIDNATTRSVVNLRSLSSYDIFSHVRTGGTLQNFIDGVGSSSYVSANTTYTTYASRLGMGFAAAAFGATYIPSRVDISEVIVYDRALTNAEREDVEYYLTRKWSFLNVIPRQVYAIQNGNWSNSTTWSTSADPAPWNFPLSSDNVYSNTFTVTADQNVRVTTLQTAALSPNIAAGGTFAINQPISIVVPSNGIIPGTTTCINSYHSTGSVFLTGNLTSGIPANVRGVEHFGDGNWNITGNIFGDQTSINYRAGCVGFVNRGSGNVFVRGNLLAGIGNDASIDACWNLGSGNLTIVGNVSGAVNGSTQSRGILNSGTGNIYLTGNVVCGYVNYPNHGILNSGLGNVYVVGDVRGSAVFNATPNHTGRGIANTNLGAVIVLGNVYGGFGTTPGISNESTGTLFISGNIIASPTAHGVISANTGARNEFTGSLINDLSGRQAVYAARYLLRPQMFNSYTRMAGPSATNTPVFYYAPESYSSTYVPHASSVRAGTAYAAVSSLSGVAVNIPTQLIGTMNVPSPASVSFNVPVESTTGTGMVSPASLQQLWSVSLDNIKTSNSLGAILKNTATIQNVGELFAYGNIITSPNQISGLQLWLDATVGLLDGTGSTLLTNGSTIATWQDQSGNNRHATQVTASARPTLLTSALNGRNCVFFDGTDWMQGISFPNLTEYTIFAVYRRKGSPSARSGFVFCTGVNGNSSDTARLTQLVYHDSTAPSPAPGYDAFGWTVKITPSNNYDIHLSRNDNFNIHSCTASLASGTGEYRLNSTSAFNSISLSPISTAIGSMIYTLGTKTWGQTDSSYFANCDIAEIIVYNTNFNATQRRLIETYLNNKWGIY